MIYHSLVEFSLAILYFLLYGIIAAGIYISQNVLIYWIIRFFKMPLISFKNFPNLFNKNYKFLQLLRRHIIDFFLFTLVGIGYIILQYIALDGAFRIFFLLIFLLGFYISKKSIGELIKIALSFLFKILYEIVFRIYKTLLFPIRFMVKALQKLLFPIIKAFKRRIKIHKTRAISKKNSKILDKIVDKI